MVFAHLNIYDISGYGHRHKDNLIIYLAHSLTLGSKRCDMKTLNKG